MLLGNHCSTDHYDNRDDSGRQGYVSGAGVSIPVIIGVVRIESTVTNTEVVHFKGPCLFTGETTHEPQLKNKTTDRVIGKGMGIEFIFKSGILIFGTSRVIDFNIVDISNKFTFTVTVLNGSQKDIYGMPITVLQVGQSCFRSNSIGVCVNASGSKLSYSKLAIGQKSVPA